MHVPGSYSGNWLKPQRVSVQWDRMYNELQSTMYCIQYGN